MDMNAVFITVMEALELIIIILELCGLCLPDPTLDSFFFSPSVLIGVVSIIPEQPEMLASHIKKQGPGERRCFIPPL